MAVIKGLFDDVDNEDIQGQALTKEMEGFKSYMYRDTKEKRTIGHGLNLEEKHIRDQIPKDLLPDLLAGRKPIPKELDEQIFQNEYKRSKKELRNIFVDSELEGLQPHQRNILTDMMYNLGTPKFSTFEKMREAIKAKDFPETAYQMKDSNWYNQTGRRGKHHVASYNDPSVFGNVNLFNKSTVQPESIFRQDGSNVSEAPPNETMLEPKNKTNNKYPHAIEGLFDEEPIKPKNNKYPKAIEGLFDEEPQKEEDILTPKKKQKEYNLFDTPQGFVTKGLQKLISKTELGKGVLRGEMNLAGSIGSVADWIGQGIANEGPMVTEYGLKVLEKPEMIKKIDETVGNYVSGKGQKFAKAMSKMAQEKYPGDPELLKGTFMQNPSLKRAGVLITEAVPSLMAAVTISTLTGNTTIGAAMLGLSEGAPMYREAIDTGKTHSESARIAGIATAGNTLLEKLPLDNFFKGLKGGFITRTAKGMTTEGTQEAVQQVFQNVLVKFGYDKTRRLTEGVIESLIAGAGSGGMIGGFSPSAVNEMDMLLEEAIQKGVLPEDINMLTDEVAEQMIKNPDVVNDVVEDKIKENVGVEEFGYPKKDVKTDKSKIQDLIREQDKTEIESESQKEVVTEEKSSKAYQEFQASQFKVDLKTQKSTDETINKQRIVSHIEEKFKVPVRMKLTQRMRKKTAGWYENYPEIIRLKKWGELEVLAHESAHHIDKQLNKSVKDWKNKLSKEMKAELKALDYQPEKGRISEGFAEFVRHYLTIGDSQKVAPKFQKYFETTFKKLNPQIFKDISELKEMMGVWYKQGSTNRVINQIDYAGETIPKKRLKQSVKQYKDYLSEKWIDEFTPFQEIEKIIEKKAGRKLRPSESPFELATFAKQKERGIARTMLEKGMINQRGEKVGKSLIEILKPIVKTTNLKETLNPASSEAVRKFLAYGVAKRSIDLHKRGIESGIDIKDAKFVAKELKNETWDEALKELTKWSNQLMNWVVEAGGISKEAAKKMRDLNPVYLPFKRVFLDEVDFSSKSMLKGGGPKAIKGSGRAIINPLESLSNMAIEYVRTANKMRVVNAIINLQKVEGAGEIVAKIAAPMKTTKIDNEQVLKAASEVLGIDVAELKKQSKDGKSIGDEFLTFFSQNNQYTGKANVVSIVRNGKTQFYELDPKLYKALQGIEDYKLGGVLHILRKFSQLKRMGATQLRPSFIVSNAVRDFAMSSITTKRIGAIPFIDPMIGVFKDITDSKKSEQWRYKALGGQMAGMMGYDRLSTMKLIDEMLLNTQGFKGKTLSVVKHPINALQSVLGVTELGARVQEFDGMVKKYRENKGWSEDDAIIKAFNDAQDVTLNFTRSGEWSRKINQTQAFFNAQIQGVDKLYRTIKDDPLKFAVRGLAYITLPCLLMWWKNKDEDWFNNIPLAYKYGNIFITIGNKVIRLPLPFEAGSIFGGSIMAGMDSWYKKDPEALKEWFNSFVGNFLPDIPIINADVISPIKGIWKNKNWLNQPIESLGLRYKPVEQRTKFYTTKMAKLLTQSMQALGFKDSVLSPVQFDYLLNQYTGGMYTAATRSLEGLKTWSVEDMPVIGRSFLRMPEKPTRFINDFWERKQYLDQQKAGDKLTKEEKREQLNYNAFYKHYLRSKNKKIRQLMKDKNKPEMKKIYLEIGSRIKKLNNKLYESQFVKVD